MITLNIAHGRGTAASQIGLPSEQFDQNVTRIADLLRDCAHDCVALQEADAASMWSGNFDHVASLAAATGYPHREHALHVDVRKLGMAMRYGTALLSNQPLRSPRSIAFRVEPTDTKGFVSARLDFAGRPVTVVSLHLDFKAKMFRRRQAALLIRHLEAVETPLIIMGDFNCTWHDAGDALRLIAQKLDVRALQPDSQDPELATFPSTDPKRRIDWILVSREFAFREYECLFDGVSDHLAVVAVLEWRLDDSGT